MLRLTQPTTIKIYNQFHNAHHLREFSNKTEGICSFNEAVQDILQLRGLHKQMDETVLKAYGWEDINFAHDFYEVDYLPENDRVRFTILPHSRKEVIKRLLKLNHEIHEQEVKAGLHAKGKSKNKQKGDAPGQIKLF